MESVTETWAAERSAQRGKPAGGFVFVRAGDICSLWQCYQEKIITFRDVRTYFAVREVVARRCELEQGRCPHYSLFELQAVVGGPSPKPSIARLQRAGLLSWSEGGVGFGKL